LRYKCESPINSGVFYHSDIIEDIKQIRFIQVEIDSRIGSHTGGLHGDRTQTDPGRGWIVWPAPENETVIRPYDWNDMLVQVEGNRVRTRVNGVQTFQLHSGSVARIRFKDIWIRDLGRPE
jgi:hypothetical protein